MSSDFNAKNVRGQALDPRGRSRAAGFVREDADAAKMDLSWPGGWKAPG